MKIRAVIFDFDGVLADSERLHYRLYQEILSPLGAGFTWEEYQTRWMALHDQGCIQAVLEDRGLPAPAGRVRELSGRKFGLFEESLATGRVDLFPGVAKFVEELSRSYPLAVCSGAVGAEIRQVLRANGIEKHFRAIVAAEDTARHKPDPEPYRRSLEMLSGAPAAPRSHPLEAAECLVFEDTPDGIRSAKGAGMRCVGVGHSFPVEKLSQADATIAGFAGTEMENILGLLGAGAPGL